MVTTAFTATVQRGSLTGDLTLNVGSQFFVRLATAVTALYAARILGPEQFGLWAVLQVVFLYTAQGHCGTVNAMMREVPLAQARGDLATARRLVNSTWGFVTASSLIVAAAAGGVVWHLFSPGTGDSRLVAIGSIVMVLVQSQSVFFQFYCRAYSSFVVLASFNIAQVLITLPLCFWLVPLLGVAGYLFALTAGFCIIPVAVATRPGIRLRFSRVDWARLLTIGLPMLPGTLMLYLNMSLERLVLASGVSALAVGIFAAGAFFFQVGGTLWELVIYTWYSRLAELYGSTGKSEAVVGALADVIPGAVWLSSSLQGALFVVLPFVLTRLLPEYSRSIAVAQVLVLTINLWGTAQMLSFAMTIIGRQKQAMGLQGIFIAAKVSLLATAVALFKDPQWAAAASFVALVIYLVSTLQWWKRTAQSDVVPLYRIAMLWSAPVAIAAFCSRNVLPNLRETGFRLVLYVGIVGAASLAVHRHTHIFRRLSLWWCAA